MAVEPLGRPPNQVKPIDDNGTHAEVWRRFFNAVYTHLISIIPPQPGSGGLGVYASNAEAKAAGLGPGEFYRNGHDPDVVCVVH